MKEKIREGKIVSFYSFKGGVGRTMALANVAFLAAMNGKRVLVMDWDLEAPGLAYYFKGLLETPDAKALKEAPGVLDLLWDWNCSIKRAKSETEIESLFNRFKGGSPFQSCVRPILNAEHFKPGGALDFIGAGSPLIITPEPREYEDALGLFSWSDFFDTQAGGHVLVNLRNWAKSKYDLVLLDSRTGLADVAGICTMQIPDTVLLCFVLNRQNIEGISKVAAAIRANRDDAVRIRAVPMRVARQGTSEESDARARAIWEFKRIGGFSDESIQIDFASLQVLAADNVPFYETLAPFTAPDPSLDPLTLNYLRLTTDLLGEDFEIPSFDSEWIEVVRRRLQPKQATLDYIVKLKSSDPIRAFEELSGLIEAAFDVEMDGGELNEDYVKALIDGMVEIGMPGRGVDFDEARGDLYRRSLDLLRLLDADHPIKWQAFLISTIEQFLALPNYVLELEEALALFYELDDLLSQSSTLSSKLKRIEYRRKAAKILIAVEDIETVMQSLIGIRELINEITREPENSKMDEVNVAEVDLALLTGDYYQIKQNLKRAYIEYQKGIDLLANVRPNLIRSELGHLYFGLHRRLAEAEPTYVSKYEAAEHAVQAARGDFGSFPIYYLTQLAQVVLNTPDRPDLALAFCENALRPLNGSIQNHFVQYIARNMSSAIDFLTTVTALIKIILEIKDERSNVVSLHLIELSKLVIQKLNSQRQPISESKRTELSAKIAEISSLLNHLDLPPEKRTSLQAEFAILERGRSGKISLGLADL